MIYLNKAYGGNSKKISWFMFINVFMYSVLVGPNNQTSVLKDEYIQCLLVKEIPLEQVQAVYFVIIL